MALKRLLLIGAQSPTNTRLQAYIENAGYECSILFTLKDLISQLEEINPAILIIDRPNASSTFHDLMGLLMNSNKVRFIPKILLSLREDITLAIREFEENIDAFVEKPAHEDVVLAHIKIIEKWMSISSGNNPVTGLAMKKAISGHVEGLLKDSKKFAFLYFKLGELAAFRKRYGHVRGDKVLKHTLNLLVSAHKAIGNLRYDLIGHLEDDAFVSVTKIDNARPIAEKVAAEFDKTIADLYDKRDRNNRFIELNTREGVKRFKIMRLNILVTSSDRHIFNDFDEVMMIIDQLKRVKRDQPNSAIVVDRRHDKSNQFSITKNTNERRTLLLKPNILYIEKDAFEQTTLKRYFSNQNMNLILAVNFNEAFSILFEEKIHIIVTGLEIGNENAMNFLQRIKAITPLKNIPVILMSTQANKAIVLQSIKSGAVRYLIKPTHHTHLYSNIYEVLVSK